MTQMLEMAAPSYGIGLCQMGGLDPGGCVSRSLSSPVTSLSTRLLEGSSRTRKNRAGGRLNRGVAGGKDMNASELLRSSKRRAFSFGAREKNCDIALQKDGFRRGLSKPWPLASQKLFNSFSTAR